MLLKFKREFLLLFIAILSISLVSSEEVNSAEHHHESEESNLSEEIEQDRLLQLLADYYENEEREEKPKDSFQLLSNNYYRKSGGGRYNRGDDSDESSEESDSRGFTKLTDYINYKVNKAKQGQANNNGQRGGERDRYENNDYDGGYSAPFYREKYPKNKEVSVSLKNYKNYRYYTEVKIGKPAKTFKLLFSTVVSFSWVPGLSNIIIASDNKVVNLTNAYDPKKSYSSHCKNNLWNVKSLLVTPDGVEKTSGLITCKDTVRIGDITLYDQTFGVAHRIDKRWYEDQIQLDGVIGLGFQCGDIFGADTVLTSLGKSDEVKKNIFSVWYNVNSSNSNEGGEITFGGINSRRFDGYLHYIPLVKSAKEDKAWKIRVESVSMNSKVLDYNFNTLVDTLDGCIKVPNRVLRQISAIIKLDLRTTNNLPCNATSLLPPISFKIRTSRYHVETFTVDYKHYFIPDQGNLCYVCFESFDTDEWVLGDAFLTKYYTVFDAENDRIGFADAISK